MQRKLLEILACPMDKHHPLELLEFATKDQTIIDGILLCSECERYYPIIEEIPVMLPDDLRNKREDLGFLEKWKAQIPEKVSQGGKPWNLKGV
jgi:uncharacterized protein YbaR (Trm112 family)